MYSEILELPAFVLPTAHVLLGIAMLLAGYRIIRGPMMVDRVVALDLIGALIMGQFILLVFSSGFVSYLEVAAAIAVVSFLATVAFARILENKETTL
ncbi:MAG: monovalent cation/H+ antiporter complex subunit F [Verrucomicrobiota bacterium]